MSAPLRLQITPIPTPLWGINLRLRARRQWEKLRSQLLAEHFDSRQQGWACPICHALVRERRAIHAHEEWEYAMNKRPAIARLRAVSLICAQCHDVEHWFGLCSRLLETDSGAAGIEAAVEHFCRVNQTTREVFEVHAAAAMRDHERRSKRAWGPVDWGRYAELLAEARGVL